MEYGFINDFVKEHRTELFVFGAIIFLGIGYLFDRYEEYKLKNGKTGSFFISIKKSLEKILEEDKPL